MDDQREADAAWASAKADHKSALAADQAVQREVARLTDDAGRYRRLASYAREKPAAPPTEAEVEATLQSAYAALGWPIARLPDKEKPHQQRAGRDLVRAALTAFISGRSQ